MEGRLPAAPFLRNLRILSAESMPSSISSCFKSTRLGSRRTAPHRSDSPLDHCELSAIAGRPDRAGMRG